MIIKTIFENKITLGVVGLTVSILLMMTACGSPVTGSNQMSISDKNVANRPPLVMATVTPTNNTEPLPMDLPKIPIVTYCELITNDSDYNHRVVRVRAIYFNEFERSYLYDSACKQAAPPVAPEKVPAETWAQWDKSFVSKGDSDEAILNRQIRGFGRSDVTLIGKFYSTNDESDSNAPNLFGHDNCCRFQFLIMKVESVHSSNEKKTADSANKFGEQIKFKVNQKLEFADFTLECLKLSKSENTFKIKENDKEMTISADNETPTIFSFNGINYKLELGVADKSGRIAKDELIVSKLNYKENE